MNLAQSTNRGHFLMLIELEFGNQCRAKSITDPNDLLDRFSLFSLSFTRMLACGLEFPQEMLLQCFYPLLCAFLNKQAVRLTNLWPSNSRSNWNLEMLVFEERGKLEYPEKNLSEQGREPTTNSTHI